MKKLNWGWRIAILYLGFVAFIMYLVVGTMKEKTDLVTPDYYAKELAYQDQIDKKHRTQQLAEQLDWKVNQHNVELKFPSQFLRSKVSATVTFYRANDSSKDVTKDVSPDSAGVCIVNAQELIPGVYTMKIDWQADSNTFYNESTIRIN